MNHPRSIPILAAGLTVALAATSCSAIDPTRITRSVERGLTGGIPEIVQQRDTAMAVWKTHYADRQPLDVDSALASTVHAARVYDEVEAIQAELGSQVRVVPVVTAITGLQYYVADTGDRQVVAIRGTRQAEIRNWVAAAVVTGGLDEVLRIDVHEGFLVAARIIQIGLVPLLDSSRPVHLTGHSLGGALATVLALRLDQQGYQVSVTTFGAPKITTFDAFANEPTLHELELVRIINAGDVVQHFPSMMDTSGRRIYAQFGREWTITATGECEETNLAASLTSSAAFVLDQNLPDWSLDAHGVDEYVERLTTLGAKSESEATHCAGLSPTR